VVLVVAVSKILGHQAVAAAGLWVRVGKTVVVNQLVEIVVRIQLPLDNLVVLMVG
jgi:hypothetical protein